MKTFSLLFIFITFTFCVLSQTEGAKGDLFKQATISSGKTHVILIGVSEYEFLEKEKQLKYADDDTKMMEEYLSTWENINIKTFINKNTSSKDEITAEIENTLHFEAKDGDLVIIYFSGHGDVDPIYNDGYFLLNGVKEPNNHSYRSNQALSMNNINDAINIAANKNIQVFLITDACRSGKILNSNDANQRMLEIGTNTLSLVSCSPNELSFESNKYGGGHGVFTYHLVQGLMGLADKDNDKVISFKELSRYVEDNVALSENNAQNPQSKGLMSKKIAPVNEEILAKVKKSFAKEQLANNNSDVAYYSKGRSIGMPIEASSSSIYMLNMLKVLVDQESFFDDEIQTNAVTKIKKHGTKQINASSNPIYGVSCNSSGEYTAVTSNKHIILYNKDNSIYKKLTGHKGGVTSVEFHPNNNWLVSSSWDNKAILWDVKTGLKIKELSNLSDEAYALRFINNSQVAIGTNKGDLYLWNIESGKSSKIKISPKRITSIEHYNNFLFIASSNGTIAKFDLKNNKIIKSIKGHSYSTNSLKIAPLSNRLYSVGKDKFLKTWDISTLELLKEIPLDFSDNRGIDIDLFENYCFIASRRYDMDVVNLKNYTTRKRYFSSNSSGLVSVNYNPVNNEVVIGDSKGRIHRNKIEISNSNYSAIKLYELMMNDSNNSEIQYKINSTMIIGLNNYVNKILIPLINGDAVLPTISEIVRAKRYASKALEIRKEMNLDETTFEINKLLTEIFQIIKTNSSDKYSSALSKIERIISLDPKGAYGYNINGVLLARLNKLQEAISKAAKTEKLAPIWAEAPCATGKILFQKGELVKAEEKFKETIKKGPKLSKGYFNLAKLYTFQGRFDEAQENYEQARSIDPKVEEFIYHEVENTFFRGEYSKSRQLLNKLPSGEFQRIKIQKANLDFLDKKVNLKYKSLYNVYKNAYEVDSNNIHFINELGYFYLRILNDKKAESFIHSVFKSPDGKRIKPTSLLKRESKRLFRKAKSIDSKNLQSDIGYWMSRGSEIKSETVESFLKKHNNSAEAFTAVGRYYIFKEDYKTALKFLKKAQSTNNQHYKSYVFTLYSNKKLGLEKKNAGVLKKMKASIPNSSILKYRKEITKYLLLY